MSLVILGCEWNIQAEPFSAFGIILTKLKKMLCKSSEDVGRSKSLELTEMELLINVLQSPGTESE